MDSPARVRNARAHTDRLRRRLTVVVGITVLVGATVATAVPATATATATAHPIRFASAAASARTARPMTQPAVVSPAQGTVHYALDEPACAVPKNPNRPRCFAVQQVTVSKGTPGARRYVEPNSIGLGPAGGYTPDDLAAAYHYNRSANRRSQLIALVDWNDDPLALKDLDAFDHQYGLKKETSTSFRKVNQQGRAAPLPKGDKEGSLEIALDIESARAVCNTCRLLLIEANSGTDKNLATAENLAATMGATEISNSFGETEHRVPAYVQRAYNHPGVVITASTGDDGWFAWDRFNDNLAGKSANAPEYPSSSPDVIAVGGTELGITDAGTRGAEYVWNENGPDDQNGVMTDVHQGAGGGGCSKLYAAPAWQSHYKGYAAAGCKGKRLAADISAIADPNYGFDILDSFASAADGGWSKIGGTSLASPVVAAMYALAGGSGGQAYPAASLYVNGTQRASSLFDVTVGGNGFCAGDTTFHCAGAVRSYTNNQTNNPNGLGDGMTPAGQLDCSFPRNGMAVTSDPGFSSECNAVPGFDGPSGLGAPNSDALFTPTNATLTIRHGALTLKRAALLTAHLRQRVPNTGATRLMWNFGDGRSATTTTDSARHTWLRAGTFTVTLIEVDNRYQHSILRLPVTVRRPKAHKK